MGIPTPSGTPIDSTALLAFWKEHREQMRQSENQRATLTNFTLVITAAMAGVMGQQNFSARTWPLAVFVLVIGAYGALAVAKYYERANYHLHQARVLARELAKLGALPDARGELESARQIHGARFRVLARLPQHRLWTALHLGIFAFGVVLLVIVKG
jgi:hypothetical protein